MKAIEKRISKLEQELTPVKEEFVTFIVKYGKGEDQIIEEIVSDIPWRPPK